MSTPQAFVTTSMLREYLGDHSHSEYSALALLAEILNGEVNLDQLHREVIEATQP